MPGSLSRSPRGQAGAALLAAALIGIVWPANALLADEATVVINRQVLERLGPLPQSGGADQLRSAESIHGLRPAPPERPRSRLLLPDSVRSTSAPEVPARQGDGAVAAQRERDATGVAAQRRIEPETVGDADVRAPEATEPPQNESETEVPQVVEVPDDSGDPVDEAVAEAQADSPDEPAAQAESPGHADEQPRQQAALPSGAEAASPSDALNVRFAAQSAELTDEGRRVVGDLLGRLLEDEGLHVRMLAYAAGSDRDANAARRLALSRALTIRSYLLDRGIRSTRIDVRALGHRVPSGDPDRVDLVPARQ